MHTTRRIVAVPRGSWIWQYAYGVVEYVPYKTKKGVWVWKSSRRIVAKASMPQLKRNGYGNLEIGSIHNKPMSHFGLLQAGIEKVETPDFRPEESIPEDYYALSAHN